MRLKDNAKRSKRRKIAWAAIALLLVVGTGRFLVMRAADRDGWPEPAPGVTADSGHDAQSTIDFNELVAAQDNAVCEAVQRGVASISFTEGVLTAKDSLVADFDVHYVRARGALER